MLCFRRRTLLRRRSIEAAVSHHGLWLIEPVPGYSRGVELGAIRFCYVVAVNDRCPCRDQPRGRLVTRRGRVARTWLNVSGLTVAPMPSECIVNWGISKQQR